MVSKMLTVYQMLLKNRFLTGIGSRYDKILNQIRPKPYCTLSFAGDCLWVDCNSENYQWKTVTATRTEILNYSSTKPGVGFVLFARGFDNTNLILKLMAKSNMYLQLFTSYLQR